MSDFQLFKLQHGVVSELQRHILPLEKQLQALFETNMESLLGVSFLSIENSLVVLMKEELIRLIFMMRNTQSSLNTKESTEYVIHHGLFTQARF